MQFKQKKGDFPTKILSWHRQFNVRMLPWKGISDPYKIWLSEIMLQQTRAAQVLPYYQKFVKKYPTVVKLAQAEDAEVFKLWEGLGYYSRCRNLLFTARYITYELNAIFPKSYSSLLKMKGVGKYTAAAIASFAYNIPVAVVDGNVIRVLSRITAYAKPVDSKEGISYIEKKANSLLEKSFPADYNQAIMDFGATVCLPKKPLCDQCFFEENCKAYLKKSVDVIPLKSKKIQKRHRFFNYLILRFNDLIWIRRRDSKDIWHSLHEFYSDESADILSKKSTEKLLEKLGGGNNYKLSYNKEVYKQTLTHQYISASFQFVEVETMWQIDKGEWKNKMEVEQLAFPRLLRTFMNENDLYSQLSKKQI